MPGDQKHDGQMPNRRSFLKQTLAGAAAMTAGPQILTRAQAAEGERKGVMGAGAHTYEWVEDWAKLPKDKQFGYTHGVIEDSQGRIFIHNQGKDAVAIFDAEGNFMSSWGEAYAPGAHGMHYSKEAEGEFLYLAPTGLHKVCKTTLDGEVVFELDYPKDSGAYEDAAQYVPTNIATAPNGDFYVADGYGQSWIHHYNAKAEHIRSWGGKGVEPGKMNCPHGIHVDTRGEAPVLVVADRGNVRLQYFTLDGEHIKFVNEGFLHPCHFRQQGKDLLIPDLYGRVSIIGEDDAVITHLGENPEVQKAEGYPNLPHEQRKSGLFISPHDAMWDSQGNIYVVEWINDGRVTKLRKIA
jgi:hypothetical protein